MRIVVVIMLSILLSCSNNYTYYESKAEIVGWKQKKFGNYNKELYLQFSVNNIQFVAGKRVLLGYDYDIIKNDKQDDKNQSLIISAKVKSFIDGVDLQSNADLHIGGKKYKPSRIFVGYFDDSFPCKNDKSYPVNSDIYFSISQSNDQQLCINYTFDVPIPSYETLFEFHIFERVNGYIAKPIVVNFRPSVRKEVVTH